jgi:hypothetical protein
VIGGLISVNLAFALIAFLKGKPKLGAFGIVIPGLARVGAVRLAKPGSLRARRFYSGMKSERSCARAGHYDRR